MISKKNISVGFLLSDVTRLLRKHFDRRATAFGLTRAQWRALQWLNNREGMNQSELAEQLEMAPIAIGRVIDRLETSDFVERRADPGDRRRWRLFLTARAQAVLDDMEEIARGLRHDAFRGIPASELTRTRMVLERIKNNLTALDEAGKPDGKA